VPSHGAFQGLPIEQDRACHDLQVRRRAEKNWRRLDGRDQLPKVVLGGNTSLLGMANRIVAKVLKLRPYFSRALRDFLLASSGQFLPAKTVECQHFIDIEGNWPLPNIMLVFHGKS
jgi:hypothetical protein